jgi:multicomponent Na+:H+ antiporter subunit A
MSVRTGTTRISDILVHPVWKEEPRLTAVVAVLVIVAALTKSAQFPFHSWLPDAMVAIMPVSAYLHAAAMVKAGIFLLMRFSPIFYDVPTWKILLISIGLGTMIMGAIFALQRDDIKELLAYSTVSQLGLLVATIGVGTKYALVAASVHVISHALFKSSLFMFAGVLDKKAGTRNLSELHGFGYQLPLVGVGITLACLSSAGILPFVGFVSKEAVLTAFLDAPGPAWVAPFTTALVVGGSILTFAYSIKIVATGWSKKTMLNVEHPTSPLVIAPLITAVAGLVLGLGVVVLNDTIQAATQASLAVNFFPKLALWHGFTTEFLLTDIVIVVGVICVYFRDNIAYLLDRPLFPSSGVRAVEFIRAQLLSFGVRVRNVTSIDSPPRHLVIPLLLLIALGIAVGFAQPELAPIVGDPFRASDWFLLALMIIPVGGLMIARSRIAGVVLLGAIGLIMTLYFFTLGAPDVGLTQLLIELLTVIFMMFSLRRLPKTFHRTKKQRRRAAAVVAVAMGILASFTAYAFTGRRELSDTSLYYLENAKEETGGTNVVNTILVDFRALDTLVELTVFATAGLAIMALLISARVLQQQRRPHVKHAPTAADSFADNNIPVRVLTRALIPLVIALSLYLMLRGHYEPGGGFIAALVTCVGVSLVYLGTTHRNFINAKGLPYLFIGSGISIAVVSGLSGYLNSSFLRPLHLDFFVLGIEINLSTALIFDTGVYLAVLGVVLAAINRLSSDTPHDLVSVAPHVAPIEDLDGPLNPSEVTP